MVGKDSLGFRDDDFLVAFGNRSESYRCNESKERKMTEEDRRILMWLAVELEGYPLHRRLTDKEEYDRWLQNRSLAEKALKRVLEENK